MTTTTSIHSVQVFFDESLCYPFAWTCESYDTLGKKRTLKLFSGDDGKSLEQAVEEAIYHLGLPAQSSDFAFEGSNAYWQAGCSPSQIFEIW